MKQSKVEATLCRNSSDAFVDFRLKRFAEDGGVLGTVAKHIGEAKACECTLSHSLVVVRGAWKHKVCGKPFERWLELLVPSADFGVEMAQRSLDDKQAVQQSVSWLLPDKTLPICLLCGSRADGTPHKLMRVGIAELPQKRNHKAQRSLGQLGPFEQKHCKGGKNNNTT